jgi:pimeloyl-ACP methyl ester carboxylesterase
LEYARLARHLGTARTVYGVQSRAFTRADRADDSVETMAAAYLHDIREVQPDGPYHLIGNCFGGLVAFEIAQQLRGQGEDVALLVLIDTAFPTHRLGKLAHWLTDPYRWRRLAQSTSGEWLDRLSGRLPFLGTDRRDNDRGVERLDLVRKNHRAADRYRPLPYDGAMTLICPGSPHDQRGWIAMPRGGCTVIEVPVEPGARRAPHLTRNPYVRHLSGVIETLLRDDAAGKTLSRVE